MNADEMAGFVDGVIAKTGGIAKWRELSGVIRGIKARHDRGDKQVYETFLRGVADQGRPACSQLLSLALLGLTLGEVVHEGRKARKRKQAERN